MELLMKDLRNALLTLLLLANSSSSLVAMKRTHGGDLLEAPAKKKLKTENSATSAKLFTLVCSDGVTIEDVPYEALMQSNILMQSTGLKNLLDDMGGIESASDNMAIPVATTSDVMETIITYTDLIIKFRTLKYSQQDIIVNLVNTMQSAELLNAPPEAVIELLSATYNLGCQTIYHALSLMIIDKIF